jgi:hypothetical protein
MRQADFPGLSRMAQDILCTPAASVGTERVFNGARDICYFRRARMLPVTIRALTMVHHFEAFHPTDEQEAMLEDSAGLAEMTTAQLKEEEEERLEELKRAWTRDYISDVEEGDDGVNDRPTRKVLRRDCPKGFQQSRATDHILAPEAEYEAMNQNLRRQDPDLYDPPKTPKQKRTQAQTQQVQAQAIPSPVPHQRQRQQESTPRVSASQQQRQWGVDLESQMPIPPAINSRSGRQIKLTGKALLNHVWGEKTGCGGSILEQTNKVVDESEEEDL